MTNDEQAVLIAELEEKTSMIYAGRTNVYEAVSEGKTIFDITPNGWLVREFRDKNFPEFAKEIVIRTQPYEGHQIHLAYHKGFVQKRQQQGLWELEKLFPHLFSD